ncbi:morphogenetic protein [Atlantibacter sp.]|uniref:morphogenetic protein n=1 Tax=Atlantibacter sp. TaxID=1903473 RepID=UPI0028A5881C|nr:morphogenetic protein [Atlantibacter sp.]
MKERGMIFNGEMVRAILDGRKTQTRRIISERHLNLIDLGSQIGECYPLECGIDHDNSQSYYREHCPFGKPGDRIWVRETFQGPLVSEDLLEEYRAYPEKFEKPQYCEYAADGRAKPEYCDLDDNLRHGWLPSIHMPRWASRILLEITDVRVERLNSISEDDARAEGVPPAGYLVPHYPNTYLTPAGDFATAKIAFQRLWQSIYGEESWQADPWVWVVEFKRVEGSEA